MRRWLSLFAALWLTFWFFPYQALHLWSWGALGGLVTLLTNLLQVALLPYTILAGLCDPPIEHHFPTGHQALTALLAAGGYTGAAMLARAITSTVARLRLQVGAEPVPERRRFLGRVAAGVVAAPVVGAAAYSVGVEPNSLRVARYEVRIPNLPVELEGIRLGHISDTHYGPFIPAGHILRAIHLLNHESPDLVLLTGDYVHMTPAAIPTGIGLMGGLQGRLGRVAVLGNHDHWEGAEDCRREFAGLDIPLLDNRRLFLTRDGFRPDYAPGSLALCGVGDLWTDRVDPRAALEGVPDHCPRLLLSHNPDVVEQFPVEHPDLRFDLQVSGHTHGGQVSLPGLGPMVVPSAYGARYAGGLVQGPRWPVVVSRGVGMAVLPVRFGVPPEVGLIVLRQG